MARYGVDAICTSPVVTDPTRLYPTPEEMQQNAGPGGQVEAEGRHGGQRAAHLIPYRPRKESRHHAGAEPRSATATSRSFQNHIRTCAATGIKTIKYNMSLLGVVRTEHVPGRGDTVYEKWNAKEAACQNPPLTKAGIVNADAFWERIDYFLKRVVPVANENKVRIACHPQDPGTPPEGYQGITNVLGTIDGMKRFITMYESPYHGFNFCQGTVSENLVDPKEENFSTSSVISAAARRSSMSISATSRAAATTSSPRCSRMKAISISSRR